MQEQLITFQVAKLAKEKGFNIPTHSYYFEDGEFKEFEINDTYGYYGEEYTVNREEFYENWNDKWKTTKKGDRCFGCDKNPKYLETFSAPTQSLLQKWLREVHNISICIYPVLYEWEVSLHTCYRKRKLTVYLNAETSIHGKTYEEALEVGLQEALKLIKNEN